MSDDDETVVRQRLSRLLGGRAIPAERSAAGPAPAGTGPDPSADPPAEPGRLAGPGAFDPAGPGAFDPGRRGVKALAVVAVVVVLGAAGWAWLSRPRTEPVAPPPASAATFAPASSTSGAAVGAAEVVVAVAGKVRRPGLVRLPAGARVADALESAGGALPGVDVALLNLARKVTDGELILVGVTPPPGAGPAGAGPPGAPGGATGAQPGGGKVNLNTATVAQLDTLPGVGPVLAQRIVAHREEHGGFRSVADLRQVTGIGDARYEDLKDLVTV
ncbi:ComEA family DNA-binding protein [Plantactinospora sp. BB1]|uniref:ComEA family DNA-binding protein n=1 Tax=Plantactinospora sp. BB1 TaxID=2071627 RepID=UPI000D153B17|nr:ComEA family DNA-binding protein [Plantactinospora sp. BB1]AVT40823.1 competence protein ComEA [Plantactinospora sp. BB1]